MAVVYEKSKALTDVPMHYCPGCFHGIAHKLLAEVLEELGETDNTILCAPVGCSGLLYKYFECDVDQCAHGRAPAVATGLKRVHPDCTIVTYQGDGDLASIGTAEIVHACMRGEKISTIFINNAIYGMTGGQMAPTTLVGQRATTAPYGRDPETAGIPIKMSEMLATQEGAAYIERVSLYDIPHINKAKKAIKKAIEIQKKGLGFAMVEILSTCPTNWGMSALKSVEWLKENMEPYYPLGVFKDVTAGGNE